MDDKTHNRLTYCKVCRNKIRDEELGTICSLTNEPADFEYNCRDYDFDKNEFVALKKNITEIVKDKNEFVFKRGYERVSNEISYYETECESNVYMINEQDKVTLKRSIFSKILICLLFIGVIFFIINHTVIKPTENKITSMIFGSLIIVFIIYLAYKHFLGNIRKIEFDKNRISIFYKDTIFYKWNEILDINVLTTAMPTKGGTSKLRTIIIDFISGKIIEYPVQDFLNKSRTNDFLFWAKRYHKNYWDDKIKVV